LTKWERSNADDLDEDENQFLRTFGNRRAFEN
jgi:hypothetical protein